MSMGHATIERAGQGEVTDQGQAKNKHHIIYNTEIRRNQMIN